MKLKLGINKKSKIFLFLLLIAIIATVTLTLIQNKRTKAGSTDPATEVTATGGNEMVLVSYKAPQAVSSANVQVYYNIIEITESCAGNYYEMTGTYDGRVNPYDGNGGDYGFTLIGDVGLGTDPLDNEKRICITVANWDGEPDPEPVFVSADTSDGGPTWSIFSTGTDEGALGTYVNLSGTGLAAEAMENGITYMSATEIGAEITTTAIETRKYKFSHWYGDLSGDDNPLDNPLTTTVPTGNYWWIGASYNEIEYYHAMGYVSPNEGVGNVTLENIPEGTSSPSGSGVGISGYEGETIELTATATSGWAFSNWTNEFEISEDCTSNENPLSIEIDADYWCTANFTQIGSATQTLSLSKIGGGSGGIWSPNVDVAWLLNSEGDSSRDISIPDKYIVNLSPNYSPEGNIFHGWGGACSGTDTCTVTMDSAKSVSAQFEAITDTEDPTISLTAPTDGSTASESETISVTASDNIGISRVDFYINETKISSDSSHPYSANIETTNYDNGDYQIKAIAYDGAGNNAESETISVTFENYEIDEVTNTITKEGVDIIFINPEPLNVTVTKVNPSDYKEAPSSKYIITSYHITASSEDWDLANITMSYPDDAAPEESDSIVYWNGSEWSTAGITDVTINKVDNKINFNTNHFSEFAIISDVEEMPSTGNTIWTYLIIPILLINMAVILNKQTS